MYGGGNGKREAKVSLSLNNADPTRKPVPITQIETPPNSFEAGDTITFTPLHTPQITDIIRIIEVKKDHDGYEEFSLFTLRGYCIDPIAGFCFSIQKTNCATNPVSYWNQDASTIAAAIPSSLDAETIERLTEKRNIYRDWQRTQERNVLSSVFNLENTQRKNLPKS
jgi:hypothetical protein